VVVESVFEDVAVKSAVLRGIEAVVGDTLIATNSSTLDIDAGRAGAPRTLLGTHFFLPAHRTPVLEIVAGKASSPPRRIALALAHLLGKLPIRRAMAMAMGNRLFDRRGRKPPIWWKKAPSRRRWMRR
jgi:3-hydroxyacyl-CoA dehydrogenase